MKIVKELMKIWLNEVCDILNTIKMLGNLLRDLLPIQKRLLYRICVLLIALYEF